LGNLAACALLACLAAALPEAHSQISAVSTTGISVQSNEQIFATMCALDAAGFDADESTLVEMPERLALRGDLLKMQGPATQAVREFYRDHALSDPGENLSRYITFGLSIGPPPSFEYQYDHDLLPPDVLSIETFQPLIANFFREAHLGSRWARIEPEYDGAIARYQSPVRRIVITSDAYLREILKEGNRTRTFTVYVEPLVGNRTNFRNFGDHYAVVVGTGQESAMERIQHAYLHFLLDPLPLKFRKEVTAKSALLNIAGHAPQLPPEYQRDFVEFTDECLIKSVELRLRNLPPDKQEEVLKEDDEEGFVLVRPLVQQLRKFEKSEPSMDIYFPDLIGGVDVAAEQKRLANFTFAKAQAPATAEENSKAAAPLSETDRLLAEGDRQIALRNPAASQKAFQEILNANPNQSQAMYGLAVASLMSGEGDKARDLFERLVGITVSDAGLESAGPDSGKSVDPSIVAWSRVYLGRLHDVEDERSQALVNYRAALGVQGAPEAARVAAQRGLDEAYKPVKGIGGSAPQKP
jgi:hypothetical protein